MLKRDVLCNVTLHSTSRFNIGLSGMLRYGVHKPRVRFNILVYFYRNRKLLQPVDSQL